jgi:hypothetical protein
MRHHLNFGKYPVLCLFMMLLALHLATGTAWSYSTGPLDGYANDPPGNQNCTSCHQGNPLNAAGGEGNVFVPPTYTPGQQVTIGVNVFKPGQSRWGFEFTAVLSNGDRAGTWTAIFPTMAQISQGAGNSRDYMKHTLLGTQAGITTGGGWFFLWTPPAAGSGPVTFYWACNAANNNNANTGDFIYTGSAISQEGGAWVIDPPAQTPASPFLVSAYPNPFNPNLVVNLTNSPGAGPVTLSLFDAMGRSVTSMNLNLNGNETLHLPLNLGYLPSGCYYLRALGKNASAMTVLVKTQ